MDDAERSSAAPAAKTSESADPRSGGLPEKLVLGHLGLLTAGLSWSFGGQVPWARTALLAWGSLGLLLFAWCAAAAARGGRGWSPVLRELWPLLLFDLCAGVACLNPSFRTILRDGEAYLALAAPPYEWLPSSARPALTWRELWQFNAIVLSCYNLRLAVRSRGALRILLVGIVVNAVALAVFGTLQKLVGAKGLWFGLVPSPQIFFFSTFVYHNHWGAFTLLNTGACLGLLFHHLRRAPGREVWHSPVPVAAVAALLLAATAPLSASRSSTVLMGILLFVAAAHFIFRLIRRRRARGESAALPVAALAVAVVLAVGAVLYLGRSVIAQRLQLTTAQLADIRAEDRLNVRLALYRDTWRMALDKPWFGWGLETYGDVFRIYNSAPTPLHGWKTYYREAHNDWLQSFAESGFVGTGLLLLFGALVLRTVPWRQVEPGIPAYLLAGAGLVLLYAWLEFPFANPSVMVAFWTSLFAAVRYAQLDLRARPDTLASHRA